MILLFTDDGTGTIRGSGYATNGYKSNNTSELVYEVSKSKVKQVFESAKANGETLDGADASIDSAIENPLSFTDYLILENEKIVFDEDYVRPSEDV